MKYALGNVILAAALILSLCLSSVTRAQSFSGQPDRYERKQSRPGVQERDQSSGGSLPAWAEPRSPTSSQVGREQNRRKQHSMRSSAGPGGPSKPGIPIAGSIWLVVAGVIYAGWKLGLGRKKTQS